MWGGVFCRPVDFDARWRNNVSCGLFFALQGEVAAGTVCWLRIARVCRGFGVGGTVLSSHGGAVGRSPLACAC